jgi:hypothetical protein
MLRYPVHGFAKRVEDTVARAMAILRAKEMEIAKPDRPASNPDIWQALARWKAPASVRLQTPSATRGIATLSRRPQTFGPAIKSHREQGHQVSQRR